ncbi:hypothetical protein HPB52_001336 [Rhipicephalus sanguineus]|uniref:Endonuclease/exonuclease/phosphatase domain-containing protein n=1 Tax=Rhipicephalus sanguineus TaxID=34632 RepID=A0A9D4QES3_RHISA|nr:hypothetical protein HPB52_001336 [Rhipicephalus sanguineus]
MPSSPSPPPPDPRKHQPRRHLPLLIMADRSVITVWQWNCRGFRPKPNHLLLHLQQLDASAAPYTIVPQESHANVSLSSLVAYNQAAHHPLPYPITTVLTTRTVAVNRADLPFPEVHHVFFEILPQHCEQPSLFLLNVYNPPRTTQNASPLALLRAAAARVAKSPLLILNDFNVKRPNWGYPKADGPGRMLFCRSVRDARWSNTHQSLGSDHYVVTIQVRTSPCTPPPPTSTTSRRGSTSC